MHKVSWKKSTAVAAKAAREKENEVEVDPHCVKCGVSTAENQDAVIIRGPNPRCYHKKCYKFEVCGGCKKKITKTDSTITKALDNSYHAKCFKCRGCKDQLVGSFKHDQQDGEVYCHKCYCNKHGKRCSLCSDVITTKVLKHQRRGKDMFYHYSCLQCRHCSEPFGEAEPDSMRVNKRGQFIHVACKEPEKSAAQAERRDKKDAELQQERGERAARRKRDQQERQREREHRQLEKQEHDDMKKERLQRKEDRQQEREEKERMREKNREREPAEDSTVTETEEQSKFDSASLT